MNSSLDGSNRPSRQRLCLTFNAVGTLQQHMEAGVTPTSDDLTQLLRVIEDALGHSPDLQLAQIGDRGTRRMIVAPADIGDTLRNVM
jgi:hypothetical protein